VRFVDLDERALGTLTMMTLYLLNSGSTIVSLNSIPSVMYFIRVRADVRSSKRIE
jgi:hypothetical protein